MKISWSKHRDVRERIVGASALRAGQPGRASLQLPAMSRSAADRFQKLVKLKARLDSLQKDAG